jgi:hypothetical protein
MREAKGNSKKEVNPELKFFSKRSPVMDLKKGETNFPGAGKPCCLLSF